MAFTHAHAVHSSYGRGTLQIIIETMFLSRFGWSFLALILIKIDKRMTIKNVAKYMPTHFYKARFLR